MEETWRYLSNPLPNRPNLKGAADCKKRKSLPVLKAMDMILPTLMILFHHQQSIYPQKAVHILVRLRCSANFTLLKVCCYSGQICLLSEEGKNRRQAAWPHHHIAILLHVNADIIFLLKCKLKSIC